MGTNEIGRESDGGKHDDGRAIQTERKGIHHIRIVVQQSTRYGTRIHRSTIAYTDTQNIRHTVTLHNVHPYSREKVLDGITIHNPAHSIEQPSPTPTPTTAHATTDAKRAYSRTESNRGERRK